MHNMAFHATLFATVFYVFLNHCTEVLNKVEMEPNFGSTGHCLNLFMHLAERHCFCRIGFDAFDLFQMI